METVSAALKLKPSLSTTDLDYIDRAWKTGNFQNHVQGPANVSHLVARMLVDIAYYKSKLKECNQVIHAAILANITLGQRREQGWGDAFNYLNEALCKLREDPHE